MLIQIIATSKVAKDKNKILKMASGEWLTMDKKGVLPISMSIVLAESSSLVHLVVRGNIQKVRENIKFLHLLRPNLI